MILTTASKGDKSAYEFLVENGFEPPTEPPVDGKIHRYKHHCGAGEAGWAVFHEEPVLRGHAGCHRCQADLTWIGVGRELTEAEKKKIAKANEERDEEKEERAKILSETLTDVILPELLLAPDEHPYLVKKGIKANGAVMSPEMPYLFIPIVDVNGRCWSMQAVHHEPMPKFGGKTKYFQPGGKITGHFFPIGRFTQAPVICICEGFATAATIYECTGMPVAASMYANNLMSVARAIRSRYPTAGIVVCADNDRHVAGSNPGLDEADTAVLTVQAGLAVPDFEGFPADRDHTDFNDLKRVRGADVVKATILAVRPPDRTVCLFDSGGRTWWLQAANMDFVPVTEGMVKLAMHVSGMEKYTKNGDPSPIDREVLRLIREESVAYAGPVAGWPSGLHYMAGKTVLVTDSCILPEGRAGNSDRIQKILHDALGEEQYFRYLSIIHYARLRILKQLWFPLPSPVLVGPKDCGKSLAQEIISRCLGGRSAKPTLFLQGQTPFNGELFGAEHLMLEDDTAKTDMASRRHLGECLKSMLFSRTFNCHDKGRRGVALSPYWLLSMSINDEPEHLNVLPVIDSALADKITILKMEKVPRDVPDGVSEAEWLTRVLREEMPAFIDRIDTLDMAYAKEHHPHYFNSRTQVAAWQHPSILSALIDMSPERQLLTYIDNVIFKDMTPVIWSGTSEALLVRLKDSQYTREVEKLLSWPNACGTYLRRLMINFPKRIEYIRTKNSRTWRIQPPQEGENEAGLWT
jgi:phage/plasmid primase-like uncharacterized protein